MKKILLSIDQFGLNVLFTLSFRSFDALHAFYRVKIFCLFENKFKNSIYKIEGYLLLDCKSSLK